MSGRPFQQTIPRAGARRRATWLVAGLVAAAFVAAFGAPALAERADAPEFLVVVHPDNPQGEAGAQFVAEAMLKKTTRWSNGETIRPVDLASGSAVRRRFSERVLKRSVAAVRSYWQQRIFAGRDVPPPELDSDEAVIHYVSKYVGAIGYVGPHAKLGDAKVLLLRSK